MSGNPKKRKNPSDQPVFLSKTWTLVNQSPDDICCWGDRGLSFVVLNQDRFAREIIPRFFKHNNFSSFVRQLNLYGFHKVKAEATLMKDEETKVLEFKHPLFQRDRPDLMSEIKRSAHVSDDVPSAEEFQALKLQVLDLTTKVNFLYRVIGNVANGGRLSDGDDTSERPFKWSRGGDMDDIMDMILQLEGGGTPLSTGEGGRSSTSGTDTGERNGQGYDVRGAPYSHDFLKHHNFSAPKEPCVGTCGGSRSTETCSDRQVKKARSHPFSHAVAAFGTICSKYGGEKR